MEEHVSKKSVITNFIWRFAERTGAQVVSFVVSIVLARLLVPDDYGTVALVTVFNTILQVFIDGGMPNALIQKKNTDDLDFSSVFYFNVFMSVVLFIGMFFAAPYIAKYYSRPDLTPLIRVNNIVILIAGVKSVQHAFVAKNMIFKKFFFATLGGTIVSAVIGIVLAYLGFGPWALVAQQLTNKIIDTIVLWVTVKWRPKWMLSFYRLKGLFSYGWKIFASTMLDRVYSSLRALIIGKVYTAADLAYYDRAHSFPDIVINNINTSIDSVLLPTMSKEQDSVETVKSMARRAMKTSTFILAPILIGLAACGQSIISMLLTDKWLPSYPFMVIFCITFVFYPLHTSNLNAIKALGRSDIFLKLEIIKKIVGIIAILVTFRISVMAMAYSLLFTSVASQIINSWPNKKLMNYSYLEQLKDILPGILLAAFMGGCVYCVNFLNLSSIVKLIIQVPLGAVIYIGLSALFKLESFTYCWNMIKPVIGKVFHKNKSTGTVDGNNEK